MSEPIQNAFYIPYVTEQTTRGPETRTVFDRLLKDRIIFLGTPIDDVVSNIVVAQLLHLESEDPDKDITIYINSPGGEITGLFAIYDTMQFIKPDISTICIGQAASAAAVLLGAGAPGKRFVAAALPRAHPPAARWRIGSGRRHRDPGQGDHRACVSCSTRSWRTTPARRAEKIAKDTDRDFIMSAEEAKAYGIVDEVISNRELASVGIPAGVS